MLGNTTIHATTTTDNEVNIILQQLGVQQSGSNLPSSSSNTIMTSASVSSSSLMTNTSSAGDTWGMPAATSGSGSIFSTAGSVWSVPELGSGGGSGGGYNMDNSRSTPLNSLLPGDLLGENM